MDNLYSQLLLLLITFLLSINVQGLSIEKELGTNKSIDVTSDPYYKLLPPLEKCGFTSVNERPKRVVGGKPNSYAKFPWMCLLYSTNVTTGNTSINCGCTFITNNAVLTAGHCLSRIITGMSLMTVGFGQSDRSKIKPCKWEKAKADKCSKKFTRRVKKFIVHEQFSEGNLNDDLGLVFLDKPVRFSSRVRPICLPYSEELLKGWASTKLRIVGWGLMSKLDETPRLIPSNLLSVETHIRERSYCDQFHTRQYGKLKGNRFCAGGEPGAGSCSGDSGGPLSKKLPVPLLDGKERVFQFGIISAGSPNLCGYQGRPLLFTNVIYHVPWILRNLAISYSLESVESFSAELRLPSGEQSSDEKVEKEIESQSDYKNELSTGLDIDILSHPNLPKLPKVSECGNIPPAIKNHTVKDSEDFDDSVEVEYDDEDEDDDDQRKHNRRRSKRMIGGRVAGIGWFPFLAQIYWLNTMSGDAELKCGGMIISKTFIITAASCVTEIPTPWGLDTIHVGNYNRNKTEDCLGSECFKGKPYSIKDVIVHKEYEKYTHQNDIALIKIAGKLEYSRLIQPICLPSTEAISVDQLLDTTMISAGYGRVKRESNEDDKPPTSNIPKYIEVNLKPRKHCERVYKRFISELGRSRLCGGGEAGKGECNGDTGGPLLKPIKIKNARGKMVNKYVQFGIISFDECGQEGMSTVYMNVIYYLPWILDHL